jgi:hypothetical protein
VKEFTLPPIEVLPASDISGRIVDGQGKPAADVMVSVVDGERRFGFGKSDKDGRFKIFDVPTAINRATATYTWQPWNGSTAPSKCQVLQASPLTLRALPRDPKIDRP